MNLTCTFLICVALAAAKPAGASSSVRVIDSGGLRIGVLAGPEAGHLDLDASVDSPVVLGGVRFRAAVGQGRWENVWEISRPPLSAEPRVTRLAAAVLFVRRDGPLSGHAGFGVAGYLPHHPELERQRGIRAILGMDYSGERWAVGPELQIDLPRTGPPVLSRSGQTELLPNARIGVAVRRIF